MCLIINYAPDLNLEISTLRIAFQDAVSPLIQKIKGLYFTQHRKKNYLMPRRKARMAPPLLLLDVKLRNKKIPA